VRFAPNQKIKSAADLVDGNPHTSIDLGGARAWVEIDLGRVQPLAGVHLWNRAAAKNVLLERGSLFVSNEPFQSDDPAEIRRQPGVHSIAITEPPGYPTPYPVGRSGRYVRIVSDAGTPLSLGEVEVLAKTK
jgi:hypothetical protein